MLENAVSSIQGKTAITQSLEELYRICENICHSKRAEDLYSKLRTKCELYLMHEAAELAK